MENSSQPPWRAHYYAGAGYAVQSRNKDGRWVSTAIGLAHDDARRIVACLNALAGVPQKVLESGDRAMIASFLLAD